MFVSALGGTVVELHRQGVRSIDIAHRLNVAQATVHYHLRRALEPVWEPQARRRPPNARSQVRTQEQVGELLADGRNCAEIARELGITKSTVSYHARRLGKPIDDRCRRRYDWKVVQAFYDEGNSLRDCRRAFGFTSQTWHEAVKRGLITPRPAFRPADEIFAANTRRDRGHLKQRLLRAGLKDGSCEWCGISEWLGEPLSVALHHVNGDRLDNRIENLVLLCPNCHSQTDNFGGRCGRSGKASS